MGHTLPIWFCPVPDALLGFRPDRWTDPRILELLVADPEVLGLRETASRNGWHLHALAALVPPGDRGAVSFLHEEVAVLPVPRLEDAARALDAVIGAIESGAVPDLTRAMGRSILRRRVVVTSDGGPPGDVDFCNFLRTLADALHDCRRRGRPMLWIAAQP